MLFRLLVVASDINDVWLFSDIFDACVCNISPLRDPHSFLVFLVFGPFTGFGSDRDLPNEVCNITNCVATVFYKKDVQGWVPSSSERKILSPDFQGNSKVTTLKAFKETARCVTGHHSNMEMNNVFFY